MNKSEVVSEVARATRKSIHETETLMSAFLDKIQDGLKKDGCVQLSGFGTFNVRRHAARKGRNPQTGKVIDIKPAASVGFRAGKRLKEHLNVAESLATPAQPSQDAAHASG
jgi:nucleoid DNA-binding protein